MNKNSVLFLRSGILSALACLLLSCGGGNDGPRMAAPLDLADNPDLVAVTETSLGSYQPGSVLVNADGNPIERAELVYRLVSEDNNALSFTDGDVTTTLSNPEYRVVHDAQARKQTRILSAGLRIREGVNQATGNYDSSAASLFVRNADGSEAITNIKFDSVYAVAGVGGQYEVERDFIEQYSRPYLDPLASNTLDQQVGETLVLVRSVGVRAGEERVLTASTGREVTPFSIALGEAFGNYVIRNYLESMMVNGVVYRDVVEVDQVSSRDMQTVLETRFLAKGIGLIKGIDVLEFDGRFFDVEIVSTNF